MPFIFQGFGKGTDGSAVERRLKKGRIHLFLGVLERWRQSIDYRWYLCSVDSEKTFAPGNTL